MISTPDLRAGNDAQVHRNARRWRFCASRHSSVQSFAFDTLYRNISFFVKARLRKARLTDIRPRFSLIECAEQKP